MNVISLLNIAAILMHLHDFCDLFIKIISYLVRKGFKGNTV